MQLSSMLDVVKPSTLKRLAEMGMLDPRRVAAGAGVLPWLAGRGPSLGLLSQIHATSRPSRTAVVDRHGELTWWELERRANRLAGALSDLGVPPGGELGMLLRNGREFVELLLAAQKRGIVPAPMNTWAKPKELGAVLERSNPPALVYDARHAQQLEGVVPEGTRLVHVGDDALAGSTPYGELLEGRRGAPPPPVTLERGRNALHIHTSGTTGTPKAAERSTGTRGFASLLGLIDTIPYRHDDVMYIPNPLFHALGIGVLAVGLGAGATMVLPDAFEPRQALTDLAEHRCSALSVVPVMLRRMLDLDDPPEVDLSALRIVLVSGSAMSPELRERARERFGEVLYDLYGSTEAGWVAIATPETMREAPESVGKPALGVEVALLDDEGNPVDQGEGEIAVRSALTFSGYASGEDADERGGYLAMGDLGRFDERGHLYVLGRTDDMVVIGGENVYPAEVESVIDDLDGVTDVAVFGTADEEMGEVLAAFVVGDVDPEEVRRVCERELASYKVPRRIEIVDELPRTATGKVLRRELAERG